MPSVAAPANVDLRVHTAESLAEALNLAEIPYVVVNGLYGYPVAVGRDIDILLPRHHAPRALDICERLRADFGWDHLLVRWSPYDTWQVFFVKFEETQLVWLEIDLMHEDTMLLGAAPLIGDFGTLVDGADSAVGPFAVSRLGHYIKSQLRPILYEDLARFSSKYALQAVDSPDLAAHLEHLFGRRLAQRLITATHHGTSDLPKLARRLRWQMNLRFALHHPLRALRNALTTRILRPVRLYRDTAGLVIVPDRPVPPAALAETLRYFNGCFDVRCRELSPHKKSVLHTVANYWLRDRFIPKSVIQFALYPSSLASRTGNRARILAACLPSTWPLVVEHAPEDTDPKVVGCSLAREIVSRLAEVFSWKGKSGRN